MDGFPGAILIGGEKPASPDGFWNADGTWRALFKPTAREEEPPPTPPAQPAEDISKSVEICRSFSYKLNLANHGGHQYESADFFCSRKMACKAEAHEMLSESLFQDCVADIQTDIKNFIAAMQAKRAAQVARAEAERAEAERLRQEQGLVTRPTAHPTGRRRV